MSFHRPHGKIFRRIAPVRSCLAILLLIASAKFSGVARADIQDDMQAAAGPVEKIISAAGPMLAEGRGAEVNAQLLAVFPEKTRTPVQALLVANVLFRQDSKDSYALHKFAAAALPNEPDAQLEWALEQHRAGEFAAAIATYAIVIKANPTYGPPLGMQAECLLRTGRTREAADAWMKSEQGSGSLEDLESWVCEVHSGALPDQARGPLYAQAKAANSDAAVKLIILDCAFERDWWNIGPNAGYLAKDIDLLKQTTFAPTDADRIRAALCAADCGIILANGDGDAGAVLRRDGFLLDDKSTLPTDGQLLSTMLGAAESTNAITTAQARDRLGPAVLSQAKATKDPETFNVAANLYLRTDKIEDIDQLGWDATGDPRFAASLLVSLLADKKLTLDDPRLTKAAKQFPNDAVIAGIVLSLTRDAGKPTEAALVNAIEAEYSHFSNPGGLQDRPSAARLRSYFAELSKELAAGNGK